jgi:hypothetical protein
MLTIYVVCLIICVLFQVMLVTIYFIEIKMYKIIILPVVLDGCETGLSHQGRNTD